MDPKDPRSLGVSNNKEKNATHYLKSEHSRTTKRIKYLEEENAVQSKVISQLITLISRSRLLTKPNRHPYCEYGHQFCKIDHRRFNYVKQEADCCWNSSYLNRLVTTCMDKHHSRDKNLLQDSSSTSQWKVNCKVVNKKKSDMVHEEN